MKLKMAALVAAASLLGAACANRNSAPDPRSNRVGAAITRVKLGMKRREVTRIVQPVLKPERMGITGLRQSERWTLPGGNSVELLFSLASAPNPEELLFTSDVPFDEDDTFAGFSNRDTESGFERYSAD